VDEIDPLEVHLLRCVLLALGLGQLLVVLDAGMEAFVEEVVQF
jgi:hypothetical protein